MKSGRVLVRGLVVLAFALVVVVLGIWLSMRASLPDLDGELPLAGLAAPVVIERDAAGVPLIRGRNRSDVARATGFLHAQERFFQMDLTRRAAAGELSELLGSTLLGVDLRLRLHRFRSRAQAALAAMPAAERALLEAYTEGVNSGLAALGARPPSTCCCA